MRWKKLRIRILFRRDGYIAQLLTNPKCLKRKCLDDLKDYRLSKDSESNDLFLMHNSMTTHIRFKK